MSKKKVTSGRPREVAPVPAHLALSAGQPVSLGRLSLRVRPGRQVVR